MADLTKDFRTVSGRRALAEALWRRWTTDRGGLIDDPNYGENLTDHINDDMSPGDVQRALLAAMVEARKDERIVDIKGEVKLGADGVLTMTFEIDDGAGPFSLTAAVSDVTVDLLTVEE